MIMPSLPLKFVIPDEQAAGRAVLARLPLRERLARRPAFAVYQSAAALRDLVQLRRVGRQDQQRAVLRHVPVSGVAQDLQPAHKGRLPAARGGGEVESLLCGLL